MITFSGNLGRTMGYRETTCVKPRIEESLAEYDKWFRTSILGHSKS